MELWETKFCDRLAKGTPFASSDLQENLNKYGWEIMVKGLNVAIEGKHDLSYSCQKISSDRQRNNSIPTVKNLIAKIYQKGFLEISLFAFVSGIRKVLPSVSTINAIRIYKAYFEIDEDELNDSSAQSIIQRMNTDFYDSLKKKPQ